MTNSIGTFENRNRDRPACSAVPQPTAPLRAAGKEKILSNTISHLQSDHLGFPVTILLHACSTFGPKSCFFI